MTKEEEKKTNYETGLGSLWPLEERMAGQRTCFARLCIQCTVHYVHFFLLYIALVRTIRYNELELDKKYRNFFLLSIIYV